MEVKVHLLRLAVVTVYPNTEWNDSTTKLSWGSEPEEKDPRRKASDKFQSINLLEGKNLEIKLSYSTL